MVHRIAVFISFIFLFSGAASAQIKLPDVTGPIVKKVPIFVPDLSSVGAPSPMGAEFVNVLRNDLRNAALFDVTKGGAIIGDVNNISFQAFFYAGADYLVA
mgnify:CR=1 FL=1